MRRNEWKKLTVKERVKCLKNLEKQFIERQDEICSVLSQDVGKTEYEALFEFIPSLGNIRYIRRNAKKLLKSKRVIHRKFKNKKSYIQYDPLGVVAIITPWNYPLILSIGPIVTALAAGNGVIYKPSEHTSAVGELVDSLIQSSGFPKNLFKTVYGAGDVGAAVVNGNIHKINFTGSLKTGKKLAKIAADKMIPIGLELGGKDPFIVLSDADLDRAAAGAVWSSNFNGGQTCSACERVIVEESVSAKFIEKLKNELDHLNFKDVREVSPLNNKQQFDIVSKQLKNAEKNSKEVYSKELPEDLDGLYKVNPSIVIEPTEKATIYSNETFGPVMTVEIAKNENEIIELANKLDYGLTASIWTKSNRRALELSRYIDAGSVYINDHLSPQGAPEVPWGGIKSSGIGLTRAEEGLLEMCHKKHISIDRFKMKRDFFWYPYSQKKYDIFKKLAKYFA